MQIALDRLRPDSSLVRRRIWPEDDAALRNSMQALGQLNPLLVVRLGDDLDADPHYEVKDGNRRLEAARALGLPHLEAAVLPRTRADFTLAAATAANLVRAALEPVDVWRALQDLQSRGYTLASAAAALGIGERRAAQLDRLGKLHPDVLALIDSCGMPSPFELRMMVHASQERQRQALRTKHAVVEGPQGKVVHWHLIAHACQDKRIPRAAAIFEPDTQASGISWQQDLFAEPGSPEEWSTTNVDAFLAAQEAALKARADASGGRLVAVAESVRNPGQPQVPKGWRENQGKPDKPTKRETVFACVSALTGAIVRVTAIDVAAERARERKAAENASKPAKPGPASDAASTPPAPPTASATPPTGRTGQAAEAPPPASEPDDDSDIPATSTAPAQIGLTKAGQTALAEAKTDALRARLRDAERPIDLHTVVALLVLALHAPNVRIDNYQPTDDSWDSRKGLDLVRSMVTPDGQIALEPIDLQMVAREALARVLSFDRPSHGYNPYSGRSGATAEWIAAAIGIEPGRHMPRLDTVELLAGCDAATLKAASAIASMKFTTAGAAKRELVGKVDGWAPAFAHFGAPGPKPLKGGA